MRADESPILVDVTDRGIDLLVEVALAGVLETEINVTLGDTVVAIHADRPSPGGRSLLTEIPRGLLSREVKLPHPMDLAEESYEQGLLTLVFRHQMSIP
jgi:HSP20 family molecular chaperone IbpA